MYDPIRDGIDKSVQSVCYTVVKPPADLAAWVHVYWELKTQAQLAEDFFLHAVPDACVNILFNQLDTEIAAVTALRTKHEVLNLGKNFHYCGIQLLPGVWKGDPHDIAYQFVDTAYQGQLPLLATCRTLARHDFSGKQSVMTDLVNQLIKTQLIVSNPMTEKILTQLDDIQSVVDIANLVGLSPRQLQRKLKQSTGFSPHDLLKILRIQQSFKQHYLDLYADQSHYIHSFRKLTGYTPAKYVNKFDV